MGRTDTRHDVFIVALAIFGATAATVGLPSSALAFPAAVAAALTALSAILAASVVAAVDDDVTAGEAAVAALIAIPLCTGVDWFATRWAPREPVWTIVATVVGCAGAWLAARRAVAPSRGYRILYAGFVTAAVLALLVLLGLLLHRLTGAKLDAVPWLSVALASALLAWRAPLLTTVDVFAGNYLATLGAVLSLLPRLPAEIQPKGAVVAVIAVVCALFAGVGAAVHHYVAKRLARSVHLPRTTVRRDRT